MAFRLTINLGNSIIGVSILTMPYCFRSCGIALSILCIIVSGLLNRLGCHLLFRSAIISRKRGFEVMALDTLGPLGKLSVEVCLLGFLVGTCVAYFVVIGDLGPLIVSDILGIENTPHLRAFTMTFVGMFIALPLGLLRRVDSLSSFSILSFGLYIFLVMKLFSEVSIRYLSEDEDIAPAPFASSLVWWDSSGLLSNIPIFAMALSCQTQLFELFDHNLLNFEDFNGVYRLNRIVRRAVHLCSSIYITVGFFGYLAFYDKGFGGNILSFLPASLGSTIAKIGFVATVAVSLPLCLFPCRTSLYSLFMKKSKVETSVSMTSLLEDFKTPSTAFSYSSSNHMTDGQFRFLTIVLIVFTVCLSIVIPHIEFVLSVVGSTTGATICFILPGMIYTSLTHKQTTERILARSLTWIGIFILIVCTSSTLITGQNQLTDKDLASRAAVHPKVIAVNREIEGASGAGSLNKHIDEKPLIRDNQKDSKQVEETSDLKKKQQELLEKLEEQQKEQKHLIQEQKEFLKELKKHEEAHASLDQSKTLNESDKRQPSVVKEMNNLTNQGKDKPIKIESEQQALKDNRSKSSPQNSPIGVIPAPSSAFLNSTKSSASGVKESRVKVSGNKIKPLVVNDSNDVKSEKKGSKANANSLKSSKESNPGDF